MSRRTVPAGAKLVASVLYRDESRFEEARDRFGRLVAPVERVGGPLPFDRTEYYEKEMGAPLVRKFIVAEGTVPRDCLAAVKLAAESIEIAMSVGGRRTANIDPGLLTPESFILATGKNYSHRVYLRDGIFADLTLVYGKGGYRPLPWTYPDYASEPVRGFLSEVRERMRAAAGDVKENPTCG